MASKAIGSRLLQEMRWFLSWLSDSKRRQTKNVLTVKLLSEFVQIKYTKSTAVAISENFSAFKDMLRTGKYQTETFIIRWMTMKSYFTCSAPTVNKGQKRNTICNGVLTSRCQAALLEHHVTALSPKLSWISFGKNDTPSCITRGFDKKTIYIHHSN